MRMHNAHAYIVVDPLPCGEISRAVFIWMKYVVTFRGWQDFEVQRDFKEIH